MLEMDYRLFLLLNAGPDPNAAVVSLAIIAAKYVVLLVPICLVGLWLSGTSRNRQTALAIFLALIIGLAISQVMGFVAYRPRPFMIDLGSTLIAHRPSSSFPSNHGLIFATCAAVLFFLRRKAAAWITTGLGLIVAWSRIYLGVHFPLDMVGSVIVAIPSAMASLWFMGRFGAPLLAVAERVQDHAMALIPGLGKRPS